MGIRQKSAMHFGGVGRVEVADMAGADNVFDMGCWRGIVWMRVGAKVQWDDDLCCL